MQFCFQGKCVLDANSRLKLPPLLLMDLSASNNSGRRPNRSDSAHISGAKANCARLKAANIQPPMKAASASVICPTLSISVGSTGMISPKPTISRNTAIRTNPVAERLAG